MNRCLWTNKDVPSHKIRKFPDIARPWQVLQVLEHFRCKRFSRHSELFLKFLTEKIREHGNIFASLTEQRELQTKNMNAIEKIQTESSGIRFFL